MGLKDTIFGKEGKSTTAPVKPLFQETAFSRTERIGGSGGLGGGSKGLLRGLFQNGGFDSGTRVILDPSIRGLQEQGISGFGAGQDTLSGAVGQFGSRLGELRSKLFGNQDPFLDARTRGLQQDKANQLASTTQNLERRGLGGSSFLSQAQTGITTDFDRQIADQRALATQESIQAGVSIDQLIFQADAMEAQGQIEQANFLRGIAQDRATTETNLLTATAGGGGSSTTGTSGIPVTIGIG